MIKQEIFKFINRIEFKTKKMLSGCLAGNYKSKTKGFGFDFNQLREYQQGDDIRYIDWKGSAKSNQLLVREYLDDKNRSVYILIDLSASIFYGSKDKLKFDFALELCAILSFVFFYSKDAVGLILFTQEVELFIPPKTSKLHVINIIHYLVTFKPKFKTTDINNVLRFISKTNIKKSTICLISDFLSDIDKKLLKLAAVKHDLIFFSCLDERELNFPKLGMLNIKDIETGQCFYINTNNQGINQSLYNFFKDQERLMRLFKIDCFNINTSKDFYVELVRFLTTRVNNYKN